MRVSRADWSIYNIYGNAMTKTISPICAPLTIDELSRLHQRLVRANPTRKIKLERVYNGAGGSCRIATADTALRAMNTLVSMGKAKRLDKNLWELA